MSLPRIRDASDAVLRARFLRFLARAEVSVDASVPFPWADRDLPGLKLSDLSTEALDRMVCRLIEAFWIRHAYRAEQKRQALRKLAA